MKFHVKEEIRVIGIDDGYFNKLRDERTIVIGVVMRGGKFIDAVLSTEVTVDGDDATEKIIEMINNSRQKEQLRIIMLDGISVAGFNVIDIEKLHAETGLPVIVVTRKKPDFDQIKRALSKVPNGEEKWKLIEKIGEPKKVLTKKGLIYFQNWGIDDEIAKKIIKITTVNSMIPEPVRVAHLIAEGITLGESKGKP